MVFLSLPLYKGQTITTLVGNGRKGGLAENGLKGFRAFCVVVSEVGNGQQWWPGRNSRPWIEMAEKGPIKFLCFMVHLLTTFLYTQKIRLTLHSLIHFVTDIDNSVLISKYDKKVLNYDKNWPVRDEIIKHDWYRFFVILYLLEW